MPFRTIPSLALFVILVAITQAQEKKSEEKKNELSPQAIKTQAVLDGFPLPQGAEFRFGNRQMRHPESAINSTLSPDGKYLATAGYKVIVIWDTKTIKAKQVIKDTREVSYYPPMGLGGLHFTPDSKRLLISMPIYYPTVRGGRLVQEQSPIAQVIDVETGKKQFDLPSTEFGHYNACWISGNEKEFVTCSNGTIRYWNISDGKETKKHGINDYPQTVPWATNRVDRVAFVSQQNQKFKVYDSQSGKEIFTTDEQDVVKACFSPDGKTLVYQTRDDKLHICNLETQKETSTFFSPEKKEGHEVVMRIAKDNRTLFLGSPNGILFRWDLKENKKLPNLGRHSFWTLSTMATNAEEKMLYTMGQDKVIQRWDLKENKKLPLPEGGYERQLSMALTTDGKKLIIGDHSSEGSPFEWDLATGKLIKKWKAPQRWGINSLGRSSDGKWLASGTVMQEVQLWDLSLGKVTKSIPLMEKPDRSAADQVRRLEFSPDNKILYTQTWKTGLSAYEIESKKLLWRVTIGSEFACDPKGRWIAITDRNNPNQGPTKFQLLDPANGKTLKTFEVQPQPNTDPNVANNPPWMGHFASVPDGSALITSHYDGSVRIWDTETAKEIRRFNASLWNQNPIACSEDGKWIAVGCHDTKIRIFELATGKEVLRLEGHETNSDQVLFTKDSRSLISNADLGPLKWTLRPSNLPKLPDSLSDIWESFASEDAAKVYRLQWALIDNPTTAVKLCESKMKPEDFTSDRNRFDKLVANLDSARFSVRESAQKEILAKGERIPIRWLMESLQASKTEEQKNRLQKMIELRHQGPSINTLRMNRALYVLEQIQNPETKALLKKYAEVADGGPLADQAKAVLERSTP
jgi:WD40 repeat protein